MFVERPRGKPETEREARDRKWTRERPREREGHAIRAVFVERGKPETERGHPISRETEREARDRMGTRPLLRDTPSELCL